MDAGVRIRSWVTSDSHIITSSGSSGGGEEALISVSSCVLCIAVSVLVDNNSVTIYI